MELNWKLQKISLQADFGLQAEIWLTAETEGGSRPSPGPPRPSPTLPAASLRMFANEWQAEPRYQLRVHGLGSAWIRQALNVAPLGSARGMGSPWWPGTSTSLASSRSFWSLICGSFGSSTCSVVGGGGGAGGRGRREDQGLNPRCAMSWLWDIQQVSYLPLEKRDSGPQLR